MWASVESIKEPSKRLTKTKSVDDPKSGTERYSEDSKTALVRRMEHEIGIGGTKAGT